MRRKTTLCSNLSYYRGKANLTQDEVSKELGINRRRYGQWEAFYAEPSSEFVVKLAVLFKVSCDELLGMPDEYNYTGTQL